MYCICYAHLLINRTMKSILNDLAGKYPAVSVIGPRQSGKTTLVRATFPEKDYVSLEDPDIREFALSDPLGFLDTYSKGAVASQKF